jgi:hypothetical protein
MSVERRDRPEKSGACRGPDSYRDMGTQWTTPCKLAHSCIGKKGLICSPRRFGHRLPWKERPHMDWTSVKEDRVSTSMAKPVQLWAFLHLGFGRLHVGVSTVHAADTARREHGQSARMGGEGSAHDRAAAGSLMRTRYCIRVKGLVILGMAGPCSHPASST